jgi:nitroreductase
MRNNMRSILKRIIPIEYRIAIRTFKQAAINYGISIASSSYLLSDIFYTLFNRSFGVEHRAVLKGRAVFSEHMKSPVDSSPQLRRNIHRLEKGLIMKPRREIFGEAFIIQTIDLYRSIVEAPTISTDELKWAKDILSLYFETVSSSEVIDLARKRYEEISVVSDTIYNSKFVPYMKSETTLSNVSYEEFMTLCQQRRSVRWYKSDSVPDELINQALDIARTAPSACNRQPFEFLVLNDKQQAPVIAALPAGTGGFAKQVPCIIVVVGDLSCYPTEADRHVMYIDSALSSMQFMLALEILGLSSCMLNWPENKSKELELYKKLSIPLHKRVLMMMSVGYAEPSGMIPYSSKKPLSVLRSSIEKYNS